MRFGPEDEHVSLYGKPMHQKGAGQLLLKSLTGTYGYTDENGHEVVAQNPQQQQHTAVRYPSLPLCRLLEAFAAEQQWLIESIRISHVQLLGTKMQFQKLASCLQQCHTLKTVIFGDSRTASLVPATTTNNFHGLASMVEEDDEGSSASSPSSSGFDVLLGALAKSTQLQEVSLQNMPELSSQALGNLCRSTSIEKLQLLMSQSVLMPTGGSISGAYIHNMTRNLQYNNTMKELRIFGVLDYDACDCVSEMLLVNTSLQKLALKIKIQPETDHDDNMEEEECDNDRMDVDVDTPSASTTPSSKNLPLLHTLSSQSCSLTSLEIYISGSRSDLERYATAFTAALQLNQSLQYLNVIFYELDALPLTPLGSAASNRMAMGGGALAAMRTNELWMTRLAETLKDGNYTLQQILINHGLVYLTDAVKFYLRLNRAGRCHLLTNGGPAEQPAANVTTSPSKRVVAVRSSEVDLWLDTLGRVRNDLSCLFYFLSCNPTLFCRSAQDQGLASFLSRLPRKEGGSPPLKKKR